MKKATLYERAEIAQYFRAKKAKSNAKNKTIHNEAIQEIRTKDEADRRKFTRSNL